nr:MAG TPA_asm: hypothetical protein [Caudoviricetes sp.]
MWAGMVQTAGVVPGSRRKGQKYRLDVCVIPPCLRHGG